MDPLAALILDDTARKTLARIDRAAPDWLERAVESIAVPETWFFRDGEPFTYLARYALSATRPLRLLSAPCSTGEEPYSMAIALLEAGVPPADIEIDAVDLSARALAAARRAVYGKASFRRPRPGLEAWFEPQGEGMVLRPQVAGLVRFRQMNLLEPAGLAGPYHAIFCRNLLIYLNQEARKRIIAAMRALLAGDGVLFAGHSEVALFIEAGFQRVNHARAFACAKAAAANHHAVPAVAARAVPPAKSEFSTPAPSPPEPTLADARRLADAGNLAEASSICCALPASAEVFYLLGLISQSSNRLGEAAEYFRRALYLDPRHRESLVQMSLLCEAMGDRERSAVFRDRARRAERSEP